MPLNCFAAPRLDSSSPLGWNHLEIRIRRLLGLTALLLLGCEASKTQKSTPTHYDLGAIHRAVTTDSAEAQVWFDRSLGRTEEAAAAKKGFDEAWIRSDVVIPGSCFCKTR